MSLLSLGVDTAPIAALDFETTGLEYALGHRVVEIGISRWEPQTGTRRDFSRLIHPGGPISLRTQQIHGITDAMVSHAAPFAAVLPDAAPLLEGAVLVAHNAPFDLGFLEAECVRAGLAVPAYGAVVDTLMLARHVFRLPSCGLGAVSARLGLPHHGAHRALADARAALAVYREMMRTLQSEHSSQPLTVAAVLDLLQESRAESSTASVRERLRLAAQGGLTVSIDYTSFQPEGRLTTRRRITVLKLKSRKVDAYCHLRDARRTFRIDRIRNVILEPAEDEESPLPLRTPRSLVPTAPGDAPRL